MNRVFSFQHNFRESDLFTSYYELISKWAARYLDEIYVLSDNESILDVQATYESKSVVPVGDINFLRQSLALLSEAGQDVRDVNMTPLEVPDALREFVPYEYSFKTSDELLQLAPINPKVWFIKDATELKKFNSALQVCDLSEFVLPNRKYVLAHKVSFESEWRTFVCDGEVIGIQRYLGDPLAFPDANVIRSMIQAYEDTDPHPRSYTIDIGVISSKDSWCTLEAMLPEDNGNEELFGKTVPIEVHPFAACGLYGLEEPEILDMLADGWNWYLTEAKPGNN